MAREFNINFNNIEMTDGMDNLLEEMQVTKVTFEGENDLGSLNSTFKNCPQLTEIEGDINLNEVTAIDCMLEGVAPLTVNLININNENMTVENSLTTAQTIIIKGDSYKKDALQNVIGSLDWLSEQYIFEGTVGEDIFENTKVEEDTNVAIVEDTLEQRVTGFELLGQTYNNEIKGEEKVDLINDISFNITESNNEMNYSENEHIIVKSIEGETYQNLVNGKIGAILEDYHSYTIDASNNIIDDKTNRKVRVTEIQGDTIQNLNVTENKILNTTPQWSKEIISTDNSFVIDQPIVEITEIWGNTENIGETLHSVGELYIDENGDPILDENGKFQYLVEIKTCGKNLMKLSNDTVLNSVGNTPNKKGIFIERDENSPTVISYDGNTLIIKTNTQFRGVRFLIRLKPNTTYTFKRASNSSWIFGNLSNPYTFTTNSDGTHSFICEFDGVGTHYLYDIQIEEGAQATEYEPYQEEITPILLPQPLRSAGSISDRLYWNYEEECYYLEKKLEEILIKGTDFVVDNISSKTRYRWEISNMKISNLNAKSTKAISYNNYDAEFALINGIIYISSSIMELNEFKKYLNENPIPLVYELKTSPTPTKISKINNKIQLRTKSITNVNSSIFPQKIVLTNKQSTSFIRNLKPSTQYSIHLRILGNTEENTITPNDLSLLSWTLGDYTNMSISDITLSDSISINANKGSTNSSCSVDFSKLFDTLTSEKFQFSCDFKVNSLSSNSNRFVTIQGGLFDEGFEVKGSVLNTTTGRLTIIYDYSSKTYSITSTGAIPIDINNGTFDDMDIKNSFKIITQNCNITYSNISLTTDNGVCIGEGENKIPILVSLKVDLGGASTVIKPTFSNRYSEYIIPITTLSALTNNNLELSGKGIKIKDIVVLEGNSNNYQKYFEGIQSIGVSYEDEYLIELSSNNYDIAWERL